MGGDTRVQKGGVNLTEEEQNGRSRFRSHGVGDKDATHKVMSLAARFNHMVVLCRVVGEGLPAW